MSQIELYSKMQNPIDAIEKMGNWIAKSGMFGCTKIEQGQVLALVCVTEQITPAQFNRTYDVLNDGKIRKKANAALAEFRNKGGKHKWIATGDDGKAAEIELTYEGQTIRSRFTIEDAKKMGASFKDGSAWVKTPGNMLRVRCISNGVTMLAPEIYAGTEEDSDTAAPEMNLAAPVEKNATPGFKPSVVTAPVAEPVVEQAATVEPVAEAEVVVEQPKPARKVPAGELPVETVQKLMEVIGDDLAEAALNYMTNKISPAWLQPGQSLSHLSESRANMILKGAERFKKAVRDSAGK